MPILNQPLRHSLHTEGKERHVCGCCFRFVDLGIGSCSIDHLERRRTRHSALVAVVRDKVIADGKAEQITCLVSPKGSHESNGAAERTVQQVRGMARGLSGTRAWENWVWISSEISVVGMDTASRYMGLQQVSCESWHARNTIFQDQAQNIRPTCVTVWRVGFGKTAWSTFAEEPDTVCVRLLVGQGLSHRRTHCWKQSWCFPACERSGDGRCRHGVDAVEDRGDDARQTTKGCRWRENEPVWERAIASSAQRILRTTTETPRHWIPKACRTNQRCRKYHSQTRTMKLQNAPRWMRCDDTSETNQTKITWSFRGRDWKVTRVPVAKETVECNRRGWRQYGSDNRWDHGSVRRAAAQLGITAFQWKCRLNVVHAPARCTDGTSGAPERTQGVWGIGLAEGNQASFNMLGDQDDYHIAKSRLTARGYEPELTGQETFNSATPQPATLRVLLVLS